MFASRPAHLWWPIQFGPAIFGLAQTGEAYFEGAAYLENSPVPPAAHWREKWTDSQ
jgi:hypothetical protein